MYRPNRRTAPTNSIDGATTLPTASNARTANSTASAEVDTRVTVLIARPTWNNQSNRDSLPIAEIARSKTGRNAVISRLATNETDGTSVIATLDITEAVSTAGRDSLTRPRSPDSPPDKRNARDCSDGDAAEMPNAEEIMADACFAVAEVITEATGFTVNAFNGSRRL